METGAGAATGMGDAGGGGAPSGGGDTSSGAEPSQVIPSLGGGDAANDNGDAGELDAVTGKPKAPKPSKHKLKRNGQEVEMSIDDILKLAGDDYEHEIQVSGQPRKAKWQDLVRGYQLHEGAFDRMRKAAEVEKSWTEKLEHGRTDPEWFMQMELGIEDPVRFFAEKLRKQIAQEEELNGLYEKDRFEFNRRQEQLAQERTKRMNEFQTRKQQAEVQKQKAAQQLQHRDKVMQDVITKNGMPWNETVKGIAVGLFEKYRAVGHTLSPQDVASMTKQEYTKHIREFIDGHDEAGLIGFLGDGWRKKLREFELAQVRKGNKQQAAGNGATPPARPSNGNGGNGKSTGISEADFLRGLRGGR